MKYLPFLLVCLVVVLPSIIFAAVPPATPPGGLVTCNGPDCTTCSVVDLVNNVVKWLIGVLMIVFAIITAYAGFGLVTSGGNPAAKTEAKQKLISAFIGLIIVLAAWILVDTLMRAILDGGNGQINGRLWTTISCEGQAPVMSGRVNSVTPESGSGGGSGSGSGGGSDRGQKLIDELTAKCGTAAGLSTLTAPTANLCSSDTAPSIIPVVTGGGDKPWRWSCGNKSCWAASEISGSPLPPGQNGCNPIIGPIVTSRPANADLCLLPNTGRMAVETKTPGRSFAWTCGFENPPISCTAELQPDAFIPLKCGPASNESHPKFPAGGLCTGPDESYPDLTDLEGNDGFFKWTCRNAATEESENCSAPKSAENACGFGFRESDNASVMELPSISSLCAVGSYVPVNNNPDVGDDFTWSCASGVIIPVSCKAKRLPGLGDIEGPPN